MKLILMALLPFTHALKGALVLEKIYNVTVNDTQHIGINIYAYAHNQSSKFTNMMSESTENIHAISLWVFPAKITHATTDTPYVVSEDNSTMILYSYSGMNNTFLASIHLTTQSNDWIQNLHSISRLEILNSDVVAEDVNWRDTANIIIRNNLYPHFDRCSIQLQSYRDVNTVSLYFNTTTALFNTISIPDMTRTVVNSTNTLIFYALNSDDNSIITPGLFTMTDTPPYAYNHTISTLLETRDSCEILENITSVTDCIDDTSNISSASMTCAQHVTSVYYPNV
jgi:hypothetical protein